jgi:hypothetical protein
MPDPRVAKLLGEMKLVYPINPICQMVMIKLKFYVTKKCAELTG